MDPIREYCYLALLVISLGGGAYFMHHEREEGKQALLAAQARADAKELQHVHQVQTDADNQIAALKNQLDEALLKPVEPHVVARLCFNPASPSSAVRSSQSPGPAGDAAGRSGSPVGSADPQGTDIAPDTESILARDKAIIDYLQGYVRDCQAAGACAKM